MPDNNLSGLYPQPPQPSQGLLSGDPLRLIGAMRELQALGIQSQTMPALVRQPFEVLRGQQIENARKQYDMDASQNQWLRDRWGSYADKPDLGPEDVYNTQAEAVTAGVPASKVTAFGKFVHDYKGGYRQSAKDARVGAIGSSGASVPVPGPPGLHGEETRQSTGAAIQAGGSYPVGNPPGTPEDAGAYQADLRRAGEYSSDINPLMKAREFLAKMPAGSMGPGTKQRREWEAFLYGLAPSLVPKEALANIKNGQQLEKYLAQTTSARAANIGPHTNEGLSQATMGSPNVNVSDLAARPLIDAMIAVRRMEHAQALQAAHGGPVGYTSRKSNAASNFEPQAFMLDMLDPKEVDKVKAGLSPADQARYRASLDAAYKAGVIDRPGKKSAPATVGQAKQAPPPPKPPIPGVELGKDKNGKPAWFIRSKDGKSPHLQVNMPGLGG